MLKERHFKASLVYAAAALVAAAFIVQLPFGEAVENRMYDTVVRWRANRIQPDGSIVIVAVDDASLEALATTHGRWPWPRGVVADLIRACRETDAIALDILHAEPNLADPTGDQRLVEAIRDHGRVVGPAFVHEEGASPTVVLPFPELREAFHDVGHINYLTDNDGVLRRYAGEMKLPSTGEPILSMAMTVAGMVKDDDQATTFMVDEKGAFLLAPSWTRFPTYSAFSLLNGTIHPSELAGKIAVIGSTATGFASDRVVTPLRAYHSGSEVIAGAIENLLLGRTFLRPSRAARLSIAFLPCLLLALIGLRKPWVLLLAATFLLAAYYFAVVPAFALRGWALPGVAVGAAVVLMVGAQSVHAWYQEKKHRMHLERLDQKKQLFTNMLVHDLRNQLVPLTFSLSLLGEKLNGDPAVSQLLNQAQAGSRRVVEQVGALLDIRRLEEDRMPLHRKEIKVVPFLRELISTFKPTLEQAGLYLRANLPDESESTIYVDEGVAERMVANLILNAMQHADEESTICISLELGSQQASLSVANAGKRLTPEALQTVLEPFVSKGEAMRNAVTRTGLGLAFCKLAAEAHGGSVTLESPWDGTDGLRVRLSFPTAASTA